MKLRHLICFCLVAIPLAVAQQPNSIPGSAVRVADSPNPAEPKLSLPPEGASVPMLDFGGRPGVNVRINGQGPFPFVVDTGASHRAKARESRRRAAKREDSKLPPGVRRSARPETFAGVPER